MNSDVEENFQEKNSNNDAIDDELSPMTDEEYQIILMRTLHIFQINLDFGLQNKDVYIQGILRVINKNLPLYFELLSDKYDAEPSWEETEIDLWNYNKMIIEFTDHLEDLYYNFFNSTHVTLDLIQEYILSVTNNILSKFNSNYENLFDKQGNIYSCEYSNLPKEDPNNNTNTSKMIYRFLINKSPNMIYTLTKIFKLSKDKSIYGEELCRNIIKICFAFINDNPDNVLIDLSTPVLTNLSKIPR